MRNVVLAAALAAALAGCGGGDGGGGGPSQTPASVTVTAAGSTPLASFGDTRALTAVVRDAGGAVIPSASVSWTSSPDGILALSGTSGLAVTATAAGNGTATIVAASGPATGQATVDVAQVLASVKVSPASVTVAPGGGTRQLTPTAADARDNAIANATGFTYQSANTSIATVNGSGLVTGGAEGTTTVTVALTRNGVTASTPVSVTVAPFSALAAVEATTGNAFNPSSVDITAGGTVTWTFSATHNVTFSGTGAPANIGNTSSGSVSRTFPNAGSFPYQCTIHPGMTATVVVH